LVGVLESSIRNSSHQKKLDENHHNFTVKSDNKYVRFPVEALISYALIIVGHDKLNRGFINSTVKLYEENIILNRGYLNREEAQRKSTVNHYWLTLLLKAYVGLTDLRPNEWILNELKKHPLVRWLILILITLLIWIGSFILILHLNANPAFNAFSFIIGSVVAFVLERVWKDDGKNL
jgi:ABC-type multidrug transport system fused ATPase/permease subunit